MARNWREGNYTTSTFHPNGPLSASSGIHGDTLGARINGNRAIISSLNHRAITLAHINPHYRLLSKEKTREAQQEGNEKEREEEEEEGEAEFTVGWRHVAESRYLLHYTLPSPLPQHPHPLSPPSSILHFLIICNFKGHLVLI